MIDELLARAAAALLNRSLDREAWARERLQPFAGCSARFEVVPFALQLAVDSNGRLDVGTGEPAVRIGVDPAAIPQWLVDPTRPPKQVRLDGDAEFAQTLSQVLPNLRPDPEEELSRFVGDAAAVRIVAGLHALLLGARDAAQRLAVLSADYLTAENPTLVDRSQFEQFSAQVIALRDQVERLEAQLQRLR